MKINQTVFKDRNKRSFFFEFYRARESYVSLFSTVKFYVSCLHGYSGRLFLI